MNKHSRSWIQSAGASNFINQYRLIDVKLEECLEYCVDDETRVEFMDLFKKSMNQLSKSTQNKMSPCYKKEIFFDFKKTGKNYKIVILATLGFTWDEEAQELKKILSVERLKTTIKPIKMETE